MSDKVLYLHVGMDKTGKSAIQWMLDRIVTPDTVVKNGLILS